MCLQDVAKEGRTCLIARLCLGHSRHSTRDMHLALLIAVPAYGMALSASGRRRAPDFTSLTSDRMFLTKYISHFTVEMEHGSPHAVLWAGMTNLI